MSGPQLLVQDTEHPERLTVAPDVLLITEEAVCGPFTWSRFVQGPYQPSRSFLTMQGDRRIQIAAYVVNHKSMRYEQATDQTYLATELNRFLIENTSTALHYFPGTRIASLHTNLPLDTEQHRPDCMRRQLPRDASICFAI